MFSWAQKNLEAAFVIFSVRNLRRLIGMKSRPNRSSFDLSQRRLQNEEVAND
jgi:hypothetical protein